MDKSVIKGLNDKIYEKRKAAAQQLEKIVREYIAKEDHEQINSVIEELYGDYAYTTHQPMARNAGLMGLAATAIALGNKYVGKYLNKILPPVLACFGDQNDQVRFYACESLYNIAKIAKGNILVYFNEVFDVLCKISADKDSSIKGAAELLDRLIKDIVSESASLNVMTVNADPKDTPSANITDPQTGDVIQLDQSIYEEGHGKLAFSLPGFISLLSERIHVINTNTRMFMISWIQVLESIPGLEFISYLPNFLPGLFVFLGDSNSEVRTVTLALLNSLLNEVETVSQLRNSLNAKESQRQQLSDVGSINRPGGALIKQRKKSLMNQLEKLSVTENVTDGKDSEDNESQIIANTRTSSSEILRNTGDRNGELYYPGQNVHLDFPKIMEILIANLSCTGPEIQAVILNWIQTILRISPDHIIPFLSKLLSALLKILSDPNPRIGDMAKQVNYMLIELTTKYDATDEINYGPIVNTLTLHFLDSNVTTKIACLDWLILIYNKDLQQLANHDESIHLTLLNSLSDKDARLIVKALELLCKLCNDSNEGYVKNFIKNLLKLFKENDKLLKTRGNYIIRLLCVKLSAEKIYRTISPIIDTDDNINFIRMVIHSLTTNLITSAELLSLRRKLRSSENWSLFSTLFKSWCHNPISLLSLCLVSEKYELAYSVLQLYVDYGLSVNDLLQVDILVQFLESPAFTRLRMQLLEQEKYPYLHKCLYGILMVLPQSIAFEILNARLNSVSRSPTNPLVSTSLYKKEELPHEIPQTHSQFQGLLDHFKQVCETEHNSIFMSQEDNVIDLNDIIEPKPNADIKSNRSQLDNINLEIDRNDSDSVLFSGVISPPSVNEINSN